ncbi:hypothetical protein CDAR_485191 [Caerostris darwini]|uniref:Uncharacterized protein n=1 Tax=Caerostris darwini TaxID=1538125 RepID=A0AAV4PAR9_9ARAC|nr:hypothetical protein CDAR_485191 [Caerostris darwini]
MEWRSAALSGESKILRHVIEARSLLSVGGSLRPLFWALRRRAKKLSEKANDEGFGLNIESFSFRYEAKLMFLEQGGFACREMRGFYSVGCDHCYLWMALYVHFLGLLGGELKSSLEKANDEGLGLNMESFSLRYEAKLMFLEQGGFARREMRGFYSVG